MIVEARVTREDAEAAVRAWHDCVTGLGRWTMPLIEAAERQFDGVWHLVRLTGAEALGIWLPPHAGEPCHGDRAVLAGPGGATVREAAAAFTPAYEAANPSCSGRIREASQAPFSRLILTTVRPDHPDYATLPDRPGLYHLDGLHRLVGWAVAGRLRQDATIEALVAGPLAPDVATTGTRVESAVT